MSGASVAHARATTSSSTLSLHDALPISLIHKHRVDAAVMQALQKRFGDYQLIELTGTVGRSEEHTSELQSLRHTVCRLLLEKTKPRSNAAPSTSAPAARPTSTPPL